MSSKTRESEHLPFYAASESLLHPITKESKSEAKSKVTSSVDNQKSHSASSILKNVADLSGHHSNSHEVHSDHLKTKSKEMFGAFFDVLGLEKPQEAPKSAITKSSQTQQRTKAHATISLPTKNTLNAAPSLPFFAARITKEMK